MARSVMTHLGMTALAIAIAGCTSSVEPNTPISSEQAATQLSTAYCRRLEACHPQEFAAEWGSQPQCVDTLKKDRSGKDEQALQSDIDACQQKIEQATCAAVSDKVECM